MLDFQNYRSILCLDGELPDHAFFIKNKLPIIAADGAANQLAKMSITPAIIIGDLDRADPNLFQHTEVLHLPNQNTSDFQKCLAYLKEHDLLPAIITGVSGGYLDHILNNINIFLATDSILYAPPIIGFGLRADTRVELSSPLDSKISLLGIPNAVVTTHGLKWELQSQTLAYPGQNSCFNRTQYETFKIHVEQGQLLVLLYEKQMQDAGSLNLS